ncbi:hypothetical protein ACHWQZ_G006358 [Mnemiopsis leidyi]
MEKDQNLGEGTESVPQKEEDGEKEEDNRAETAEQTEELPDKTGNLEIMPVKEGEPREEPEKEDEIEEEIKNGEVLDDEDEEDYYYRRTPVKVHLDFREEEPDDLARIPARPRSTDWLGERSSNTWFTEPAHLNLDGTRKSDDMDSSAVEDYLKSLDKMDNIRDSIDSLRRDLELSELRDDLNQTRRKLRSDLELSRSYRLAAEDLDEIETRALDAQVWSEAAPRPRLTSSATPYRDHLNTLRLRSLRLEEKRLLEIRRLQARARSLGLF